MEIDPRCSPPYMLSVRPLSTLHLHGDVFPWHGTILQNLLSWDQEGTKRTATAITLSRMPSDARPRLGVMHADDVTYGVQAAVDCSRWDRRRLAPRLRNGPPSECRNPYAVQHHCGSNSS